MKKYILLIVSTALLSACGGGQQAKDKEAVAGGIVESRQAIGHNHAPDEACDHDHDHSTQAGRSHTYGDGKICTGDHADTRHEHRAECAHGDEGDSNDDTDHNHTADSCVGHSHDAHSHTADSCAGHTHDACSHTADPHAGPDHDACSHTTDPHTTDPHTADPHAGHDHDACSHTTDPHAGHDHGTENPDEIVFPASQAAKTDFRVDVVSAGVFSEIIKTSGQIMPAQGQQVTLAAPVAGIVSFGGSRLSEGSAVALSQSLFYVSSKNIATGDQAARTSAAYQKAKADYERARILLEDKIVSQRDFEAITAEYLQAKNEYEALAGSQSERGTRVGSPISGYLTSLSVGEGDFVEMGQTLATVSQNRRLVLRADVSQRYFRQLQNLRGANFTVPYDNRTYRLADMGGRLISVGQSAVEATSLIPVTFEFDNDASVVPGSYVEVFLLGPPVADAVTLPLTAITEQQGLYYVYVQIDAECYERREVILAGNDGERVRVQSGIRPGERVVTRGAVNVKLAAASGAIPHGHEH